MQKKKILLIDDEKDFCELLKDNLETIGDFEVEYALSGREGIRLARKLMPHVILLDVLMSHMSGLEVQKRLKSDDETLQIPIIMLSTEGDDMTKIRSAELYSDLYVTKPVDIKELKTKIDTVLSRRRGVR